MTHKSEFWLSAQYTFIHSFFAMLYAAAIGFSSVFLLSKGFSNADIGLLLTVSILLTIMLQSFSASFFDKHKNLSIKMFMCILTGAVLLISVLLVGIGVSKIAVAASFILIYVGIATQNPFVTQTCFLYEKHGNIVNYAYPRGLGSLCYAFFSAFAGGFIEKRGPDILPLFYIVLAGGLFVSTATYGILRKKNMEVPADVLEKYSPRNSENINLPQFVKKYKNYMYLLCGYVLIFFAHQAFNNFILQTLENVGGNSQTMGIALFISAGVELPTMFLFYKMIKTMDVRKILRISAVAFTLKHIILYFAPSVGVIYFSQFLQIFAYALFVPASVFYVNYSVQQSDVLKGQALLSSAMMVGSIASTSIGGVILQFGGVSTMLLVGAVVSFIGSVIVITRLK